MQDSGGEDENQGGAVLNRYQWAANQLLLGWKERAIKKPRDTLPTDFTSRTLRFIRRKACSKAGVTNCGCWSDGELNYLPENYSPCKSCAAPGVSIQEFSSILFGSASKTAIVADLNKHEKAELLTKKKETVRAYLSGRLAMQPDDLRRALANAYLQQWLHPRQLHSIHQNLLTIEATSSWLLRFTRRLKERVSYKRDGTISDDPAACTAELDVELASMQAAFLKNARDRIARASHIAEEDKPALLQICSTQKVQIG